MKKLVVLLLCASTCAVSAMNDEHKDDESKNSQTDDLCESLRYASLQSRQAPPTSSQDFSQQANESDPFLNIDAEDENSNGLFANDNHQAREFLQILTKISARIDVIENSNPQDTFAALFAFAMKPEVQQVIVNTHKFLGNPRFKRIIEIVGEMIKLRLEANSATQEAITSERTQNFVNSFRALGKEIKKALRPKIAGCCILL
ncbi:hypothetical protein KAU11_01120 [Candidatus Babeliales bacterium]|nr:hypothetical protein [Candidatus Babeliales bacterium]